VCWPVRNGHCVSSPPCPALICTSQDQHSRGGLSKLPVQSALSILLDSAFYVIHRSAGFATHHHTTSDCKICSLLSLESSWPVIILMIKQYFIAQKRKRKREKHAAAVLPAALPLARAPSGEAARKRALRASAIRIRIRLALAAGVQSHFAGRTRHQQQRTTLQAPGPPRPRCATHGTVQQQ